MRSSPNPYCTCESLMIQQTRGGPWLCVWCDLPPAVEVAAAWDARFPKPPTRPHGERRR